MGGRSPARRRFLAVAALAVTALVLAACGSSGPQDRRASGSVKVWVLQDNGQNPVQRKAAEDFNKTSDVKVEIVPIGADQYTDKLRVSMGSPNAPDVFFNWGGGSIKPYVDAGQLVDLTPRLQADTAWRNAFLPSVLDAGRIGDKYYGIPLRGMQPVILFYNKDVFAKAGAQPPRSWDDLLRLIDTFKAANVTPFALAGSQDWTELMWLEYLTDRYGGAEVFQRILAGQPGAWRDAAVTKALATIQDLVDRGAFGSKYASVDYNQGGASTIFARGRAAMHLMGSWEFSNQVTNEPKFAASGLGFTTFPAVPGGKGDADSVVGNPTNYFSVNAKSAHVDTAIEFLRQAMPSTSYVDNLINAGDVPPIANIAAKLGSSKNSEFATWTYQMVERAPSFTLSWDQALPRNVSQVMLESLQKVFLKQLSPDGFVSAVEAVK